MIEIKTFRVWHVSNKNWCPIVCVGQHQHLFLMTHRQGDGELELRGPLDKRDFKLSWYTRIKDYLGLSIYEGDIVRRIFDDNSIKPRDAVVEFDKNLQWSAESWAISDLGGHNGVPAHKLEIVGNIYERGDYD